MMADCGVDRRWRDGLNNRLEEKYGRSEAGIISSAVAFPPQRPRPCHAKAEQQAQADFKANLPKFVAQLKTAYPGAQVEVWSFDEHRLGLKPIVRRVWAPIGERPIAIVNHRYEWLYLYGFVHPQSGQTEWLILPRVNVAWFNQAFAAFAKATGAGATKRIVLVLDGAGWHRSAKVIVKGIEMVFLPPYSPELQPAERLWELTDEPLVNRSFSTLDELESVLVQRCQVLLEMNDDIRARTNFHWWHYAAS